MPLLRRRIRHSPQLCGSPQPVEGFTALAQQFEEALRATVLRPQLEYLARQGRGPHVIATGMFDARELNNQLNVVGRTSQPLVQKIACSLEILVGRNQPRQTDAHLGPIRVPSEFVGE